MVVQQPQYLDGATWTGYDWSARINGAHADDPMFALTVDGGAAAVDLLDGMTVLVGSSYGEWDKGVFRVRGDQSVGPATTTLNIGLTAEARGWVEDDDYLVVLDEFRFWQRYGRIVVSGQDIEWYKDYDIEWDDLGGNDAARRLAMMPPVPNMYCAGVKFVEIGSNSAQFYFDWQYSYATAPGEVIDTWTSEGETDHAGGTWNSALETPGWQTVDAISGLRGFRVTLEVDDGNGNATTLPFRRGIRYVFTLRRPGETQVGDPPNAEPIIDFELTSPPSATTQQGYWTTSVRVYAGEADKYTIMPEALVVLFTEDTYTNADGTTYEGSVGPLEDRYNVLMVGRIVSGSIREDPETGDVTFDVASPGAEAAMYHNYPVVIQNDDDAETWIDTPDLTVDRACHYYMTWHTNLNQIADYYQSGSTIEIYAQDFLEGTIYDTLNGFLWDRLFARLTCDKYGRFFGEIDGQDMAAGVLVDWWTMQAGEWLEEATVRENLLRPVIAVDAGGLIYTAGADPPVTPKLSRAPGTYDGYRGVRTSSNALAITSQANLNTLSGRHLNGLNHTYEVDLHLPGNWRFEDIAPQRSIGIGGLVTERGTLTGTYIVRGVTNNYDPRTGTIFTDISLEQEMNDGVVGVTIPIPDELPDPDYSPDFNPGFGGIVPLGEVPGEPPADASAVQFYTTRAFDLKDYWTDDITAAPPVWNLLNHDGDKTKCTVMMSATTNRFFGYGYGIWEYAPLPFDTGAWSQLHTEADIATEFGYGATYNQAYIFRMQFTVRPGKEGWAWAGTYIWYTDGGGDEHVSIGVLHTRDAWTTIQSAVELFDVEEGVDMDSFISVCYENGLALDMHSNTIYVAVGKGCEGAGAVPSYDGFWRLYRSQDFGQTYSLAQEETQEWATDGYGVDQSDMYVDCWVPWVSNSYAGGAVFWTTTCLQETNVAFGHEFVPQIYRSLNHGLSYEDIGDDGGDLDHGVNILGGPYNSLDRVYAVLCTEDGLGADNNTVFTWVDGDGWTEFRHVNASTDQSRAWVVIEQTGFALTTGLGFIQPYWLTSASETDKQRPNDDTFDIVWVP
jgi:hypothetical protein